MSDNENDWVRQFKEAHPEIWAEAERCMFPLEEIVRARDAEIERLDAVASELHEEIFRMSKVIEAARMAYDSAQGVMPIHECIDELKHFIVRMDDAAWTRLYAIYGVLDDAFIAYDQDRTDAL